MAHWSDQYLGLAAEGKNPCWLLARKIWIEQGGLTLPSYESEKDVSDTIARNSIEFAPREIGQEQELDCVIMFDDFLKDGKWQSREGHIGIVVAKGLLIHVHREGLSMIESFRELPISRLLAFPRPVNAG